MSARDPRLLLITTLGLGHLRPASGTWGSLPPVVIAGLLALWGQAGSAAWYITLAMLVLVFSAACVLAGDRAEAVFGRKDPSQAVADETAGMALTLLFIPARLLEAFPPAAAWLIAAFLFFRACDIIKPWPANTLQRVPGGWGILLDDLVAALYAGAALLALSLTAPS